MRSSQWLVLMTTALLGLAATLPMSAMADMEGRAPFTHVHYESAGIDNSGPIKVDVTQDTHGVAALEVLAFGSTHPITKDQLGAISGYKFNSVGVSYSKGYSNVGGRTFYVLLCQVFSSESQPVAMIVIREYGPPKVVAIKPPLGIR